MVNLSYPSSPFSKSSPWQSFQKWVMVLAHYSGRIDGSMENGQWVASWSCSTFFLPLLVREELIRGLCYKPLLTMAGLRLPMAEFFALWDILSKVVLQPGVEDANVLRLSTSGQYLVKSAYEGFFIGYTVFRPWKRIWKTWAPGNCHFFMWLLAHNKWWTTDRLARWGLPHPAHYPHCDREEEIINHMLV